MMQVTKGEGACLSRPAREAPGRRRGVAIACELEDERRPMVEPEGLGRRDPLFLEDFLVGQRFISATMRSTRRRSRSSRASSTRSRSISTRRPRQGHAVRRPGRQRLAHRGHHHAPHGDAQLADRRRHHRHRRRDELAPARRGRAMCCAWRARSRRSRPRARARSAGWCRAPHHTQPARQGRADFYAKLFVPRRWSLTRSVGRQADGTGG